jgi:hypothetical protein
LVIADLSLLYVIYYFPPSFQGMASGFFLILWFILQYVYG